MNGKNEQFDENIDLKVSPEFKRDLSNLFQSPDSVPPEVDRAVLDRASRKLIRPRRRHRIIRRIGIAAATAAVIILAFSLDLADRSSTNTSITYLAQAKSADIDHSGRVDILDAFKLARQIESAADIDTSFDMNGDGLVDRDDVEFIAKAAVRLDKGVL